jgi:hypothetical protein
MWQITEERGSSVDKPLTGILADTLNHTTVSLHFGVENMNEDQKSPCGTLCRARNTREVLNTRNWSPSDGGSTLTIFMACKRTVTDSQTIPYQRAVAATLLERRA